MASVTSRASGFWTDRMSYFEDTEQGMDDLEMDLDAEYDKRTPLDKTIDRIGMGSYQWTLLSLCGFGEYCHDATIPRYSTTFFSFITYDMFHQDGWQIICGFKLLP
ncbi:hypothetical protein BDR03DRAFT_316772 [Suillus americanus]|nr:hypothetical protein BDR03DRAFT_316772 [Suillus americanus]